MNGLLPVAYGAKKSLADGREAAFCAKGHVVQIGAMGTLAAPGACVCPRPRHLIIPDDSLGRPVPIAVGSDVVASLGAARTAGRSEVVDLLDGRQYVLQSDGIGAVRVVGERR